MEKTVKKENQLYEVITTYKIKVKKHKTRKSKSITSSEIAKDYLKQIYNLFTDDGVESSVAIFFDVKLKPISFKILTTGELDFTVISPRDVFKNALLVNAASVILSHNHPSGNVTPSKGDDDTTKKIKEAGDIIGIELLDHIIIDKHSDNFYSYKDNDRIL